MTEADLKRKLASIEALLRGATTDGERAAAQHVFDKLKQKGHTEEPEDLQFSVPDVWARKLFIAMVRKAGLEPFRLRGQRSTTRHSGLPYSLRETPRPTASDRDGQRMVHGRRSFVVDVVFKQFGEAQRTLADYLAEARV